MRAWEHIINTAMLGTDKPEQGNAEFPPELLAVTNELNSSDKESVFLQKAALIYNYRQCGFIPLQKQDLPLNKANPETKHYCSDMAANVLTAILAEDCLALLELWLAQSSKNKRLLPPEVLPVILDKANQYPVLRPFVIKCSGNRGEWLSRFNPMWNYFTGLPDEELWQTGKPAERVKLLQSIRQKNPDMAREMLQQTWPQEDMTSRVEFLKRLHVNVGLADLSWLESLLTEKGQKVKDEVLALLKQIPGSSIIRVFESILSKAVVLKKEKALLGMMNKIAIVLQLPDKFDESIFKLGIEKLSGPKSSLSDNDFIIYQLISFVPPAFWEKQFDASPAQVVEYFEKYAASMLPALALAVSRFKEDKWALYFLNQDTFYPDFINMLQAQEQEKYLLRFIDRDTQHVIHHAFHCKDEWRPAFAMAAISYMANNPYQYNRGVYNQTIKLIPVSVLNQLEKIEPKEPNMQSTWEKIRAHLIKLLTLKQQTLQAFNQ